MYGIDCASRCGFAVWCRFTCCLIWLIWVLVDCLVVVCVSMFVFILMFDLRWFGFWVICVDVCGCWASRDFGRFDGFCCLLRVFGIWLCGLLLISGCFVRGVSGYSGLCWCRVWVVLFWIYVLVWYKVEFCGFWDLNGFHCGLGFTGCWVCFFGLFWLVWGLVFGF